MAEDVFVGRSRNGRTRYSDPTSVGSFITGQHSVTTSGTTMSNSDLNSGVRIKASGGQIFVGGSGVSFDNGYALGSGDEVFIDIDSMNKVFVRAAAAGSTASFIAS
jgi:hypothetical protein|tara:strand:- start:3199 stop:3516 length:318 start_codon:yes stop_codon:yes gene_type:complete